MSKERERLQGRVSTIHDKGVLGLKRKIQCNIRRFKVAQNSFQDFPRRRF